MDDIKWTTICGHAYYANMVINSYLERNGMATLEDDKDFAQKAWLLAQHSDFDPEYQLRMSDVFGASEQEHMKKFAGYLKDRGLVDLGKEQIYGTQLTCKNGQRVPFPTVEMNSLNDRRASVGLSTIEERLERASPCRKKQALPKDRGP